VWKRIFMLPNGFAISCRQGPPPRPTGALKVAARRHRGQIGESH
jgi:hypothetical protein